MALFHKQRKDPLHEAVMGVCRAQHHRHFGKLYSAYYLRFGEYLNGRYVEVVAAFDGLHMRLLGIALASFSSGEWTKN